MSMTAMLPFLMAYAITGQEVHEWLGTAMLLLFTLHHILNFQWIKNLFKGKYTAIRIFTALINILLLFDIIGLAVSGIIMSGYVFDFLNIHTGMIFARRLHMFSAYWGFIIMSIHLGQYWNFCIGALKRIIGSKTNTGINSAVKILVVCISVLGIYFFFEQNIIDYLFLKTHFVFFDFEKNSLLFFCEYIAMMVLFAAMAYYLNKGLQKLRKEVKNENI